MRVVSGYHTAVTLLYLGCTRAPFLDSDKVNTLEICWARSSLFILQYPVSWLDHSSCTLDICKMAHENALKWLVSAGGWYDETAIGLQDYPGMGLGAVALRDIEVMSPGDT